MIAKASSQSNVYSDIYRAIEAEFGRRLSASARRQCGRRNAEAEDVAQEAFLRLFQALHAGRFPGVTIDNWNKAPYLKDIRTFLFGSPRFIRLDFYRRQKRWNSLNDPRAVPERSSECPSVQCDIDEAIEQCTPDQRETFLRKQEGETLRENAEEQGLTPSTVRSRYLRARDFLQERLKEYAGRLAGMRARYA